MRKILIVYFSFTILLVIGSTLVSIAYGVSGCEQVDWGSPLEGNMAVNSPFNPPFHDGTDYYAVDGDNVHAVADGTILKNDYRVKNLMTPDPRTGLMKRGWGRYVVIKHNDNDGSTTLYAHLQEGSTNHLYNGMPINKGDTIGKADSTGGVTGSHLHLEYTPNGNWWIKSSKRDPHPCIVCSSQEPATVTLSGLDAPTDGSQYTATGGSSPYTWTISKGSITQTGVVTVSGQCGTATVTVTDFCGNANTKEVRMASGAWVYLGRTFFGNSSDCCISVSDYPHKRSNPFQCYETIGGTQILYWLMQTDNVYCGGTNFCYQSKPSCYPGALIPALDAIDTWGWRCP